MWFRFFFFMWLSYCIEHWRNHFHGNFISVYFCFLFLLFFKKNILHHLLYFLGSLPGATRSWRRWSTCCSTTSPRCRPTPPPTCSTCATGTIGWRLKWVSACETRLCGNISIWPTRHLVINQCRRCSILQFRLSFFDSSVCSPQCSSVSEQRKKKIYILGRNGNK